MLLHTGQELRWLHVDALSHATVEFVRVEVLNETGVSIKQIEGPEIRVALCWILDNA